MLSLDGTEIDYDEHFGAEIVKKWKFVDVEESPSVPAPPLPDISQTYEKTNTRKFISE